MKTARLKLFVFSLHRGPPRISEDRISSPGLASNGTSVFFTRMSLLVWVRLHTGLGRNDRHMHLVSSTLSLEAMFD